MSSRTIESRTSQKIQHEERMFFENMLNNRRREKLAKAQQDSQQLHAKLAGLPGADTIHQVGHLIDSQERLHLGGLINRFDELFQRYRRHGAEILPKAAQETPESLVRAAKSHRDRYLSRENLLNFSLQKKQPRSESLDSQTMESARLQDYTSEYFSSRYGTVNRLTKNESTIGALVIHLESLVELGETILKKAAEAKAKPTGRDKARGVVISRLMAEVASKVSLLKVELEVKNSQLLTNTERVHYNPNSRLYQTLEKKDLPVLQEPAELEEHRFKTDRKASASEVEEIVARLYRVKDQAKAVNPPEPKVWAPAKSEPRRKRLAAAQASSPAKQSFEKAASLRHSSYYAGHVSERSFEETESEESAQPQSPPESSRGLRAIDKVRAAVDRIRNKQSAIERTGKDIRQSICVSDPTALLHQLDKLSSDFTILKQKQGLTAN